ncbi:uncharacterized protein METZ01_LOCUS347535, partial [marine metagenome]
MPFGISPETPNDSESGRRNDYISLLPLRRESMKTCGKNRSQTTSPKCSINWMKEKGKSSGCISAWIVILQKLLEEVGSIFDITRERVRQLQNIAIKKMQTIM